MAGLKRSFVGCVLSSSEVRLRGVVIVSLAISFGGLGFFDATTSLACCCADRGFGGLSLAPQQPKSRRSTIYIPA